MLTNRSAPPDTTTPVLFHPDVRAAVGLAETVRDVEPEESGGVTVAP